MSILAFLSEPFSKYQERYYSNKASLGFIKACFSGEQVVAVGRVVSGDISQSSVNVSSDKFEEIYNYTSIQDFSKKVIKNPTYLINYIKRCDFLLDKYPESKLWVRNPSIGCLIFSMRALKKNRTIYNHMCANAMNAWENEKYSGVVKVFAYLFSLILKYLVIRVVSHPKTINLCTGKELEDFCLKYNSNSHQIIDSNITFTSDRLPSLTKPFKLLFIGRVQKDKGIHKFLREFIKLDSTVFHLDVVGDGDMLSFLKKEFKKSNIEFHGQQSNSELFQFLNNTNSVVVPSDNKYEGFPRVILEAWSHGLPVIVSDVGGVRAFVEDGINGFLFDWRNPKQLIEVLNLISNNDVYKRVSKECSDMKLMTTESYWVSKFKGIKSL